MKTKLTVAVLFGGQSSEHEISCISAVTIITALDKEKYETVLIGITKEGQWLKTDNIEQIESGEWREGTVRAVFSPDAKDQSVLFIEDEKVKMQHVDVVFPVLHGMYGEDGTVQGIFELAKIPYVGCGVLASAVAMDKAYTKVIVDALGIRQARYVLIHHTDLKAMDDCVERVEEQLQYPVFVKPSKAGSSKGVSKAIDKESLIAALNEARQHDIRILVEETIRGREIECAVLGGYEPEASMVGEIVAADDFYTYEAKYLNQESKTDIHPELPAGVLDEVRQSAVNIFKAVDGFGLSRVDFFLEYETNEVVFNEINTLPGFTAISMYPMLWGDMGYDKKQLTDKLIEIAFQRYEG